MMFPISDYYMIAIYDGKLYLNVPDSIADRNEIMKINQYQVISADERIIARNAAVLDRYARDAELIEKRNRIRNSKVTTNAASEGRPGQLIAASSRSIPYNIRLSMFSLPRPYRKIPMESRDTFPRKYNTKYREALIYRASSIRDIYKTVLGNRITKYDCKRIQNGYVNLLHLFDDYWEVPEEERVQPDEVKINHKFDKRNFFQLYE